MKVVVAVEKKEWEIEESGILVEKGGSAAEVLRSLVVSLVVVLFGRMTLSVERADYYCTVAAVVVLGERQ